VSACWLSALNAIYRDIRYMSCLFWFSFGCLVPPVAYPSSLVPERWRWLYGLNPMTGVIEGIPMGSETGHGKPPGGLLFVSIGIVAVILCTGLVYFQRMETTIARCCVNDEFPRHLR